MKNIKSGLFLIFIIVFAGYSSFIPVVKDQLLFFAKWQRGSTTFKENQLYGNCLELFRFAYRNIPKDDDILLFSQIDPALIPYFLHPRKIYQVTVEPETDHLYMKVPKKHYLIRDPASFNIDWIIKLLKQNNHLGIEFWH